MEKKKRINKIKDKNCIAHFYCELIDIDIKLKDLYNRLTELDWRYKAHRNKKGGSIPTKIADVRLLMEEIRSKLYKTQLDFYGEFLDDENVEKLNKELGNK